MASYTLAIFKLLNQIISEQDVPFFSMCCNDDEEAISECMAIGACCHLPKPLTTGSFNMLRNRARHHKSKRATPVGRNTFNGTASSSSYQLCLKAKEGRCQQNASNKLVLEPIRSVHNAPTTESIIPRVSVNIREPSRPNISRSSGFEENVKEMSAEAVALKDYSDTRTPQNFRKYTESVWDKYDNSLRNDFSWSSRWQPYEQSAESMDTARDKGSFREGKRTAGGIGYGACSPFERSGSDSLLTSFLGQTKKNNLTKTGGNNDNVGNTATLGPSDGLLQCNSALLDGTNKSSSAQMDLTGPADDWEEMYSFWMTHMNGTQEQRNVRDALVPDPMMLFAQTKEAAVEDAPLIDPVMQFEQTEEVAVGDAPLFNPMMQSTHNQKATVGDAPLFNHVMQFAQPQEATVGDAPVPNPVMELADTQEADVGDAPVFDPVMQFTQIEEDTVGDAPLSNPVMQSAQTEEATVGDAPVPDPVMPVMQIAQSQQAPVGGAPVLDHVFQSAQEDIFWSFSPLVGDSDMLFPDPESA